MAEKFKDKVEEAGHKVAEAATRVGHKVGEKVEIGFRPLKDGSRGGQLMSVKLSDGQKVCSNRGCGDGTGQVSPPL